MVDNATLRINRFSVDKCWRKKYYAIQWIVIYRWILLYTLGTTVSNRVVAAFIAIHTHVNS